MMESRPLVPGSWIRIALGRGRQLEVQALAAAQAVELIAHDVTDPRIRLSTLVTALAENVHRPRPGLRLWSQDYTPLLRLESQSHDRHDMFLEACNPGLKRALYGSDTGTSCWENFREGIAELGLAEKWIPYPLGLFREAAEEAGRFQLAVATSQPGDIVRFVAERDIMLIASACPVSAPPNAGSSPTVEFRWETDDARQQAR